MQVTALSFPEIKIFEPDVFSDHRGYYMESYSLRTMHQYGIDTVFVQDNHLLSLKPGTIRGIHFQNFPKAQAKLLRCTRGKILDVAIDLRKNSPFYRKYVSIVLSAESKRQIYIPRGFGHACLSLAENTEVQYKVDEYYFPEYDRSIAWNDPEIAIDWGMDSSNMIVSMKDQNAPTLKDSDVNFTMENCL